MVAISGLSEPIACLRVLARELRGMRMLVASSARVCKSCKDLQAVSWVLNEIAAL